LKTCRTGNFARVPDFCRVNPKSGLKTRWPL